MARKRNLRTRTRTYARRGARRFRRGSRKLSLVDTASLLPGAVKTYDQMGGIDGIGKNPKGALGLTMENYLGYDPVKGKMNLQAAWQNQWKPFLVIQGGKRLLGAVFPKLKRIRLFGKKVL